jgi:hypothetical protein
MNLYEVPCGNVLLYICYSDEEARWILRRDPFAMTIVYSGAI